MNRIEKELRKVRPREPSSTYFDNGLARIAAPRSPRKRVGSMWQYATIGLALLLSGSIALNVALWPAEKGVSAADGHSGQQLLVYSVHRPEGDLMVRETVYEHSPPADEKDE